MNLLIDQRIAESFGLFKAVEWSGLDPIVGSVGPWRFLYKQGETVKIGWFGSYKISP